MLWNTTLKACLYLTRSLSTTSDSSCPFVSYMSVCFSGHLQQNTTRRCLLFSHNDYFLFAFYLWCCYSCRQLRSFRMVDKGMFMLHEQYHGDAKSYWPNRIFWHKKFHCQYSREHQHQQNGYINDATHLWLFLLIMGQCVFTLVAKLGKSVELEWHICSKNTKFCIAFLCVSGHIEYAIIL